MMELLERLGPKERRGSKPRCRLLTHGMPADVAQRLTDLVKPFARIGTDDVWMPRGLEVLTEAQLHLAPDLLSEKLRQRLASWWLPAGQAMRRTPNFDLASTCTIDGTSGLLLVEAKAHLDELENGRAGRRLASTDSEGRRASHLTIGTAIEQARSGLAAATRLMYGVSRDRCYQMSNRFAWAWKVAQLGVPVVLVYLGFLNARDMSRPGELPFTNAAAWDGAVRMHSASLFPDTLWNTRWDVSGVPFVPLIRSMELPLDLEAA